jgi:hypothetical protein
MKLIYPCAIIVVFIAIAAAFIVLSDQSFVSPWTDVPGPIVIPNPADEMNATVTAINSSLHEVAVLTCDGTDDQKEIVQALSLAGKHGTVVLSSGVFNCTNCNIVLHDGRILSGQGDTKTVLHLDTNSRVYMGSDSVISDFRIIGEGYVIIAGSNNVLNNIIAYDLDNSHYASFLIYPCNQLIENVQFNNCKAVDCDRWGFVTDGEGDVQKVKNIRYINCQAINCGRYNHTKEGWDVGFSPTENVDGEDILIENCVASGCWQSGFHFEVFCNKTNVTLRNCHAEDNGYAYREGFEDEHYVAGYYLTGGITCDNCTSVNNIYGYRVYLGEENRSAILNRCSDKSSIYGILVESSRSDKEGSLDLDSCTIDNSSIPLSIEPSGYRADLQREEDGIDAKSVKLSGIIRILPN